MRLGPRSALITFGLAYALLIGAWLMSSRPFAAPDETAHYLRALTIANGHLTGPRAPSTLLHAQGPISLRGQRWQEANSRAVRVPAALSPPLADCLNGAPDRAGSCTESTYTGNYQPLPYLLPALALDASDHTGTASWLTRVGSALPAGLLLLLACAVLWDGTAWSLLGLAVAVTPMALFVSSVLNPNGIEIAACIAFLACLLRIAREPRAPVLAVAGAAVSGAVAVLAWQLGPLFVVMDLLLFVAVAGRAGVRPRAGGSFLAVLAALLVAFGLYLAYASSAGGPKTTVALDRVGDLHSAVNQLRPIFEQAVGTFGALTVPLPAPVHWLWWVLAAGLAGAALAAGTPRERLLLLGTGAVALAFPVLFEALVYRHTGFGLQGRYVLPVLVMVPLLAAEILRSRSATVTRLPRYLPQGALGLLAVLQLVAWWVNARAAAGRPHAVWFASGAHWTPPAGWGLWILLAALASGLLVLSGVLAARPRARGAVPWSARG